MRIFSFSAIIGLLIFFVANVAFGQTTYSVNSQATFDEAYDNATTDDIIE